MVPRIKKFNRINILLLIKNIIESHLGKNPNKGGKPPNDKRRVINKK